MGSPLQSSARATAVLASAAWLIAAGQMDAQVPYEHEYKVACAGDVDGDGTSEILVSSSFDEGFEEEPTRIVRRIQDHGAAFVCSFAKRRVLAHVFGQERGERLGSAVATIEEYGPARAATVLIGEPGFDDGRGRVVVLSAETLGCLRPIEGDGIGAGFGAQILVPEDFVGGNRSILVASVPVQGRDTRSSSVLSLLAFDTDERLARHALAPGDELGRCALVWIPDSDGDGIGDFAIGIPNALNDRGQPRGRVEIRSGRTLAPLREILGMETGAEFGAALATSGARTPGGQVELLIGAPGARFEGEPAGDVLRCDLRTGVWLSQLDVRRQIDARVRCFDTRVGSRTGEGLASLGDVDGDGIDDYAVGGPTGDARMQSECGWVRVVRGADNEALAIGMWSYEKDGSVPLPYDGLGGRLTTLRILRSGKPCGLLAASSTRHSWVRGAVFFDLARIAKHEALEKAALWEATHMGSSLELRTHE